MTCILDIETDSADPTKANLKFFGGLDCNTKEISIFQYNQNLQIKDYIKQHKILIGFNLKNFDIKVLENFGLDFKYHIILDLWEALAPRGEDGFGEFNKDRLHDINPSLVFKNYKLKTITETLKLDEIGKGDIDYSIFQKNEWNESEQVEINKYLEQDLNLTFKLYKWYKGLFEPLKSYLPKKEFENLKHLSCTSGCLAYKVLCHLCDLKEEYNDKTTSTEIKKQSPRIEGGHHIHARYEKVRGKIICRDFISFYPTIAIQYKLLPETMIEGVKKVLSERLKAKANKDKVTALALKVPLNSFYGILGNPTFKNVYNPSGASEITRIGRELLKKYAKTLDVAGFVPLYGFTDSVYCLIPSGLSEEDLDLITNHFISQEKNKSPNPLDSFSLGIDKKLKFMWFMDKKDNNYLWVDEDNKIGIKGGLFDINVPKSVSVLFEKYISPKIIKDLDVAFTESELLEELKKILSLQPELSAEEYNVKDVASYKSTTSLQYQISEKYGKGNHLLIPNTAGVGVGRNETIKYCSLEDFYSHNLDFYSIHISRMMKYLKPFYTIKDEVLEI